MKNVISCLVFLLGVSLSVQAQSYFTRNGEISFISKAEVENIQAVNKQVLAVIEISKNQVAFNLLIKSFLFEKQLMQDHFNEEVMESNKFPKASFVGKIVDKVSLLVPGKYHVEISGKLTMHGITQPLSVPADIVVSEGKIITKASFNVAAADYNIKIPSILKNNIAKTISVDVSATCAPLEKNN